MPEVYDKPKCNWVNLHHLPSDPENYYIVEWSDSPSISHGVTVSLHGCVSLFRHFMGIGYTNLSSEHLTAFVEDIIEHNRNDIEQDTE